MDTSIYYYNVISSKPTNLIEKGTIKLFSKIFRIIVNKTNSIKQEKTSLLRDAFNIY
jgi:hypothetical protein